MRFVDEFRDAEKAQSLSGQIAALCEPGRHYSFMEVCGGHTHTIYKHGLEDYLPESVSLVHGPGCPVCVIPMGRLDDAIYIAEQPDVIMTSFGDMMRVPGGKGSFFDSKAKGADIRMVYSPLDILASIYQLMIQLRDGRCEVENQYTRVVPWDGNLKALQVINEVMELRPYFEWRGLGFISHSALKVRPEYAKFDAEEIFKIPGIRVADPKACQCGEVLKGVIKPWECKVFGTACTPETPIGTCMVSPEGACAAYFNYGRFSMASERTGLNVLPMARS